MSHMEYFNTVVDINERIYDSHVNLITKICNDLGQPERVTELIARYLDEKTVLNAKKDKNRPKKNKTSYLFYMMEVRNQVVSESESAGVKLGMGEVATQIGKKWNALPAEEKKKYEDMAAEDKVRYSQELEAYNQALFHSETGK